MGDEFPPLLELVPLAGPSPVDDDGDPLFPDCCCCGGAIGTAPDHDPRSWPPFTTDDGVDDDEEEAAAAAASASLCFLFNTNFCQRRK